LVDDITGVVNIDEKDIEPAEEFLQHGQSQVEGVARLMIDYLFCLIQKN